MSLQKGPGRRAAPAGCDRFPILDLGDRLDTDGAFLDTAAVMMNLDLVVARGHGRRPPGRGAGRAGVVGVAICPGLALAARARGQPLVSSPSPLPPEPARRLERSV